MIWNEHNTRDQLKRNETARNEMDGKRRPETRYKQRPSASWGRRSPPGAAEDQTAGGGRERRLVVLAAAHLGYHTADCSCEVSSPGRGSAIGKTGGLA